MIFLKTGFHAACFIGAMPLFVQIKKIKTWVFDIIHCNLKKDTRNVLKRIYYFPPAKLSGHTYSQFHKTLPKSSYQMYWISVRFYDMGDST